MGQPTEQTVDADAPSVPRVLTRRLGSGMGQHAAPRGLFFSALPWVIAAATVTWVILMLRQIPCRQTDPMRPKNTLAWMCFSDIPVVYQTRGLGSGTSAMVLEYPFMTKWFIWLTQQLAFLSGSQTSRNPQMILDGANTVTMISALLLFFCFLAMSVMMVRLTPGRGFQALLLAASPSVMLAGMVSWDMWGTLIVVLAIWLWTKRMPFWAGVAFGLAGAALFHPILYVVPLMALCFRADKFTELGYTLIGFSLGFGFPMMTDAYVNPQAAGAAWDYMLRPGPDYGSLWFILQEAGLKVPGLSTVQSLLIALAMLGIVAITLLAPRRPRVGQLLYLTTTAVLIFGRGYSPQYVLWLLPLVILAIPRWQEWLVWTIGEALYFAAIWGRLSGATAPSSGGADRVYWAATLFRIALQLWMASNVIHDIYHPDDDPVRTPMIDDPIGGVLSDVGDIEWIDGIQNTFLGTELDEGSDPSTGSGNVEDVSGNVEQGADATATGRVAARTDEGA